VLATLRELGLEKDTLVVFSSDNGPTHDVGGVDTGFFKSAAGLRGLKGSLYEGGIRVPCIARWPGRVPAGRTTDFVSGFEDWMPTFLDAVGAAKDVPADADGISLLPTLLGREQPPRPFLYREFAGYGGQQAVWQGPWKAVRQNLQPKGRKPPKAPVTEIYNLETDPAEATDVAAQNPELLARLEAILRTQHRPSTEFPIRALDGAPSAP
jgi:arylsulfatase